MRELRCGGVGPPDVDGRCVVYWMQRAQRGVDNHAVDLAVKVGECAGAFCCRLLCWHLELSSCEFAALCFSEPGGCRILRRTWRSGMFRS